MKKTKAISAILFSLPCLLPGLCGAAARAPVVAVAANFMGAMEGISDAYRKATGNRVETVYSSTGKLYAQIRNGAPYDLFLAADEKRPDLLAQEGFCEKSFVYATGRAVLWSKVPALAGARTWQEAVLAGGAGRIAIASPDIAPYGGAAMTAIETVGLRARLTSRLIYGQNVAQPFQYAHQGSADLAFTAISFALSEEGKGGRYWLIPEAPPVIQKGCLVRQTARKDTVSRFRDFLDTPEAATILAAFGYR